MIAPRAYSREEEKNVTNSIKVNGNRSIKLASDAIKFESKESVTTVEREAAPQLKSLFKVELPPPKEESHHSDDGSEEDLFGKDEEQPGVIHAASNKEESQPVSHDQSEDDDIF